MDFFRSSPVVMACFEKPVFLLLWYNSGSYVKRKSGTTLRYHLDQLGDQNNCLLEEKLKGIPKLEGCHILLIRCSVSAEYIAASNGESNV